MSASVERHKALRSELSTALRSLRLSHDVRKAELTKLQSEFAVSALSLCREPLIAVGSLVPGIPLQFFLPQLWKNRCFKICIRKFGHKTTAFATTIIQ